LLLTGKTCNISGVTTTLAIDELFAAAARAMKFADPNEVVMRALRLAAEDSIELYTPERIAEFERSEKELEEFSPQRTALSQWNGNLYRARVRV
jgi:hypothetical protein